MKARTFLVGLAVVCLILGLGTTVQAGALDAFKGE